MKMIQLILFIEVLLFISAIILYANGADFKLWEIIALGMAVIITGIYVLIDWWNSMSIPNYRADETNKEFYSKTGQLKDETD